MTVLDDRGRLFGLVNLVDAGVAFFVLALVPLGYATFLLFRPATPHIDSVTRAEIARGEHRIADGTLLTAKVKVRGSGLNPMLRATIGNTQALAFVFENPNSADVLIGPIAPGSHDLVLYDGVQEVARAVGAVTIQDDVKKYVRVVGWITSLDEATAKALKPGLAEPQPTPDFEIVTLGRIEPARTRVRLGLSSHADLPIAGLVEREAVMNVRCDPPPSNSPCSINGVGIANPPPVVVQIGGRFIFEALDLLPTGAPTHTRVVVRLLNVPSSLPIKAGDRDSFLDERAAVITALGARDANSMIVTMDLGTDDSREGPLYRNRVVKPGAPFSLSTDRYETAGVVVAVDAVGTSAK
jgi:hypothetical protein